MNIQNLIHEEDHYESRFNKQCVQIIIKIIYYYITVYKALKKSL